MTTYTGNATVKGGYYLNVRDWKLEAIEGPAGTLPAGEGASYLRVPLLAMLVVAPVLGLLFVVLLPFLGLAVLVEELWHRAVTHAVAHPVVRPAAHADPTTVRR